MAGTSTAMPGTAPAPRTATPTSRGGFNEPDPESDAAVRGRRPDLRRDVGAPDGSERGTTGAQRFKAAPRRNGAARRVLPCGGRYGPPDSGRCPAGFVHQQSELQPTPRADPMVRAGRAWRPRALTPETGHTHGHAGGHLDGHAGSRVDGDALSGDLVGGWVW